MLKTYDITQRTQVYADRKLLKRAVPNNILGQTAQVRTLPRKSGTTVKFREYRKLDPATTPLQEGVTPTGKTRTYRDVTVQVQQFGDFIRHTDWIEDTHEDPILNDNLDALGEQQGETWDILRAGVLVAGTNVLFANGSDRTAVNTPISKTLLRKAERALMRQHAKTIKEKVTAGTSVSTSPIAPAFIAYCHSDLKMDLEKNLPDWTPTQEYASGMGLINGEAGASGSFRFVFDNNIPVFEDAGGTAGDMISTTGSAANVYPIIIVGRTPMVWSSWPARGPSPPTSSTPRRPATTRWRRRGPPAGRASMPVSS
jgi:N4-gp56 family major capsid protein